MSSTTTPTFEDTEDHYVSPSPQFGQYGKQKTVKIGFFDIPLFWANFLFAFLAVTGQVGQNVSLPLWVDSTNANTSGPTVDSYFVLSFASSSFVIIFGLGTLLIRIISPQELSETEKRFPHGLLFLVGFCDALNGLLVVFASKGSRTPPYLQAILGNFIIPLTVLFRWVHMFTWKFMCAAGIVMPIEADDLTLSGLCRSTLHINDNGKESRQPITPWCKVNDRDPTGKISIFCL